MSNYAEKRDFQRMAIDCQMSYRSLADGTSKSGLVKNLSGKGFLLEIEDEFASGSEIFVKLTPQNSITPPMEAKAVVIRSTQVENKKASYKVACEIVEILD